MTDEQELNSTPAAEPQPEAAPPAEPTDELARFKQDVEAAQAQAAENLEGWQRERANFANYKKRVEKEQAEMYQNAVGAILTRLLPALDDFDRAMKERATNSDLEQWAEGIGLIYRKLRALVEAEGVTRLEAEGQTFDPNFHEAIAHETSEDHADGQIIEVLQPGYKLGNRVLRPALVRVAK